MVKRFIAIVLASGALLSAAAADYFPVETGNAWTFSYVSTSMPVVPNPPTTRDSGTVKWEIYRLWQPPTLASNATLSTLNEAIMIVGVIQTRSLVRRTLTQTGASGYDSVFTPPRTKIDTISLSDNFPLSNEICFPGDTCPFAVHDPTIAMPVGLSSKDTTVPFVGSLLPIACKKMIVSECSCLHKWYSYSFTLGPTIGPVEASITQCPGLAGVAYQETWKLINREYPTAVLKGNAPHAGLKAVAASQSSGRITCSMRLGYSSQVHIEFLDVKGRLIKTLFKGSLNAGAYLYSWNSPRKTANIALLRVRTGTENQCIRIMTNAQ